MATWTGVARLSVELDGGDERGTVYANGRNRIGVTISVEPTDENGNAVELDPRHLLSRLRLIDYTEGQEWFRPQIVAYDQYGNTGTFWVDGSDITGGLNLYDHPL
ncbi:hypothetical protein ACFVFS_13340 [Kitasatospora sp. NPDC057692]|uniref:hypothetical protein n=1 Tax=Kitasatospora sp. NPDC057692 TaxID=3346215 RepID=UPI0036B4E8DC